MSELDDDVLALLDEDPERTILTVAPEAGADANDSVAIVVMRDEGAADPDGLVVTVNWDRLGASVYLRTYLSGELADKTHRSPMRPR